MEQYLDGDYVCLHCHIIYREYGSLLRCDLCNRKLRWRERAKVEELGKRWTAEEHRKGMSPDFAYRKSQLREVMGRILGDYE